MTRILLIIAAVVVFFASSPHPAKATSSPDNGERKSSTAELLMNGGFNPTPGTYYYDVFLKDVRLGKLTLEVRQENGTYNVAVGATTRNAIGSIYRIRYRGEAALSTDPLRPQTATISEQSGNKEKVFHLEFPEADTVSAVEVESRKGKIEKQKYKEFESESFVLDPFSAVFLIRALDWQVGTKEIFDVYTGKKQYELELYCQGETEMELEGQKHKAWEIVPVTRTLTDPQEVKMSSFVLYLSQSPEREILQIVGHPKIGRIVASMRKFERIP